MTFQKNKKDRSWRQPEAVCNKSSKGKPLTISSNSIVSGFPAHFKNEGGIFVATIKKRGGSYLIRCYDGYDQTGRQIERTMTWRVPAGMSEKKAEREARHQAELFEEKVRTGQSAEQKIKFADFCDLWMKDYAAVQLRPKTVQRYQGLMERIKPALGSIYLDRLRPTHLTAFYKELSQTKKASTYSCLVDLKAFLRERKTTQVALAEKAGISTATIRSIIIGTPCAEETANSICAALNVDFSKLFQPVGEPEMLSGQTILHYHRLISVILQTAVQWQYVPANVAERVKPPKAESNEAIYLDDKQAIRLLELMEEQPIYYRTAVTVLLFTGMRRGELMGLRWSDIDFENNLITIERSLQYLPDKGVYESDTKTRSSRRAIKAPASALASLKAYRTWQRKLFLSIGQPWEEEGQVFVTQNGSPMHPDTLTSWFGSFIKTTDLPQIHIHSLRHTNATLQIANGVAVTTVAGTLGHSTANTTTKIYAHSIQSAAAASAEMMDNLLNPMKKQA